MSASELKSPLMVVMEVHIFTLLFVIVSKILTFRVVLSFASLGAIVADVIVYYCITFQDIVTCVFHLKKKAAISLWLCCSFSTVSVIGLGLPLVVCTLMLKSYDMPYRSMEKNVLWQEVEMRVILV